MRVLVTGGAGQLGTELAAHCAAAGDEVVAVDRVALDIADRGQVLGAITSVRPDVVVNCAAWTAVDACEGDPDMAMRLNAHAVRW
ncbi:MAG: sugar nucleotide-binding protein, partial [Ilumatobacteraceae bacterium]